MPLGAAFDIGLIQTCVVTESYAARTRYNRRVSSQSVCTTIALLASACGYARPADVEPHPPDAPSGPNTAPTLRGIESVPGSGVYRTRFTSRDRHAFQVLFDDPDPDQTHTITWYVTAGTEPTVDDVRETPIDFRAVSVGENNLFVEVSDGREMVRGGPYPITVTEFAGHALVFGSSGTMYSDSIVTDAFGSLYASGYFYNSASLSPDGGQVVTASAGLWMLKLDAAETFVYGASWPGMGSLNGLGIDSNQNVYVTGSFSAGSIDMNPGSGVDMSVTPSGYGSILVKLDRDGNYAWGRSWTGSGSFWLSDMQVTSDAVFVTGYMIGTADMDPGPGTMMHTGDGSPNAGDAVLLKLDLDGNLVWARGIGQGDVVYGDQVAIAADGSILLSGTFTGTVDMDPGPGTAMLSAMQTSSSGSATYLMKLAADGTYRWGFSIGGESTSGFNKIHDIAIASDGSVYTVGQFASATVDFDPGAAMQNRSNQGSYDVFIAKHTAAGTYGWVQVLQSTGHESGRTIELTDNEDLIVGGTFQTTLDLDPTAGTDSRTSASGMNTSYLVRLGNDGSYRWSTAFGGSAATDAASHAIGSYLYTLGYFSGITDFDPGTPVTERTAPGTSGTFINCISLDTGLWTPGP